MQPSSSYCSTHSDRCSIPCWQPIAIASWAIVIKPDWLPTIISSDYEVWQSMSSRQWTCDQKFITECALLLSERRPNQQNNNSNQSKHVLFTLVKFDVIHVCVRLRWLDSSCPWNLPYRLPSQFERSSAVLFIHAGSHAVATCWSRSMTSIGGRWILAVAFEVKRRSGRLLSIKSRLDFTS